MFSDKDIPDEAYWVEVGGDGRISPYGMHKTVNRNDVEVVNSISDDESDLKRWVLIRDGEYEAWVRVADQDEYGYEVRSEERVSRAEFEAITLKHAAIRDGSNVSVEEARAVVDSGEPEQVDHALISLYYAAKTDPDVTDDDVENLRELMREYTDHVDTSHPPTLRSILEDVMG